MNRTEKKDGYVCDAEEVDDGCLENKTLGNSLPEEGTFQYSYVYDHLTLPVIGNYQCKHCLYIY